MFLAAVPAFDGMNKQPHNYNATEGEDVDFICDPHAEPEAEITWYINGNKLNCKLAVIQNMSQSVFKRFVLVKCATLIH